MEPDGSVRGSGTSHAESTAEAAALDWLGSRGWVVARGLDITADTPAANHFVGGGSVGLSRFLSWCS